MLLVLNPQQKLGYFKKHWSADLQGDVVECAEVVVWASSRLLIHRLIHISSESDGYH